MLLPLWMLAIMTMAVGVILDAHRCTPGRREPASRSKRRRVADARRRWRRGRRHPARVADVSERVRSMRTAWRPCSDRSAARRSRSSGSTMCSKRLTASSLLGFSRIVGWIDRISLTACSTCSARGRCRRATSCAAFRRASAQDYVYGVAVGCARARAADAAGVADERACRCFRS